METLSRYVTVEDSDTGAEGERLTQTVEVGGPETYTSG